MFNRFKSGILIREGNLILRPLRFRDRQAWNHVRRVNNSWLNPWEATRPSADFDIPLPSYNEMVRQHFLDGRELRTISLAMWIVQPGQKTEIFIGQITLGGLVFGAYRGGNIGYWIDQNFANRGLMTRAVKALTKYGFEDLLLHRIEINIRPENEASIKVAEKAGYLFEGHRPRYLHIDGDWRDHLTFVSENLKI